MGFPADSAAKNLPAMQETQVWSLGRADLLEKGMATHSNILAWEMQDRVTWWATVHGVTNSRIQLRNQTTKTYNQWNTEYYYIYLNENYYICLNELKYVYR